MTLARFAAGFTSATMAPSRGLTPSTPMGLSTKESAMSEIFRFHFVRDRKIVTVVR